MKEKDLAKATQKEKAAYRQGEQFGKLLDTKFELDLNLDYKIKLYHEMTTNKLGNGEIEAHINVMYNFSFTNSTELRLLALSLTRDSAKAIIDADNEITNKKKKIPKARIAYIKSTIEFCNEASNLISKDLMNNYKAQAKKLKELEDKGKT